MIPAKIILKANGKLQPGVAIDLCFAMARKNSFHYTVFLDADGTAEIGCDELLRSFDEDRKLFVMDYGDPHADFSGEIGGHILVKQEIEKRIEAVKQFGKVYHYQEGYLEKLSNALYANIQCDPAWYYRHRASSVVWC